MRRGDKLWFVKSLLLCAGGPQSYKGQALSERDRKVSRDALLLWVCVVRSCVVSESLQTDGRLIALLRQAFKADLFDLLNGLESLDTLWLASVSDAKLRSEAALKAAIPQGSAADALHAVKGLLRTHWQSWFSERSVTGWAKCHQAFCFLSRLNLEDDRLREAAYTKWCEVEFTPPEGSATPTETEKSVVSAWFPLENAGLIFDHMNPHHSSGSTYEKVSSPGEKAMLNGLNEPLRDFLRYTGWDDVVQDTMLQSLYPRIVPGKQNICDVPANRYLEVDERNERIFRPVTSRDVPCHRGHLVPKNWKVYRFVSCEPIAYMYWQQALAAGIQWYLRERISPSLSGMYCVNTEWRNRELALRGSRDGSISTIDLSSASDYVYWRYVAQLFEGTALQQVLELTRTSYAEVSWKTAFGPVDKPIPGDSASRYRVEKYAPMGSALCFPIETIVFATVLRSVYLDWRSSQPNRKGCAAYCSAYGDDTTCPTEFVELYMARLEAIGFKVNRQKSFFNAGDVASTDFFRESCGGEYLNGTDVTPMRISRKFQGFFEGAVCISDPETASRVAQLMQLANDLFSLRTARQLVLHVLIDIGRLPVLFDEDGSRGVRSCSPTNYHLRRRWNNDLQREEVHAVTVAVLPKWAYRSSTDKWHREGIFDDFVYSSPWESCPGEVRLFEYLRQASMSRRTRLLYPEDEIAERMEPYSTISVARVQWVAAPLQNGALVGDVREETQQYTE